MLMSMFTTTTTTTGITWSGTYDMEAENEAPDASEVEMRWNSVGTIAEQANQINDLLGVDWHEDAPAATGSDYQIKWSLSSGDTPDTSMTVDTWYSLGTNRTISLLAEAEDALSCTIVVTIREDGDSSTETSATIDVAAESAV